MKPYKDDTLVDTINRQLVDLFGKDTITGEPMYRVVWSQDQMEKRMVDVTPEGIQLLTPILREVPKYRQYIKERYVLENLVVVPEYHHIELAGARISYEPLFVFENHFTKGFLPPNLQVAKLVIDNVLAAKGKKSLKKYVDKELGETPEEKRIRLKQLEEDMFGNETEIGDALAYREGVSLSGPHNNKVEPANPEVK